MHADARGLGACPPPTTRKFLKNGCSEIHFRVKLDALLENYSMVTGVSPLLAILCEMRTDFTLRMRTYFRRFPS